jgi:hypothetical protein
MTSLLTTVARMVRTIDGHMFGVPESKLLPHSRESIAEAIRCCLLYSSSEGESRRALISGYIHLAYFIPDHLYQPGESVELLEALHNKSEQLMDEIYQYVAELDKQVQNAGVRGKIEKQTEAQAWNRGWLISAILGVVVFFVANDYKPQDATTSGSFGIGFMTTLIIVPVVSTIIQCYMKRKAVPPA